MISESAAISSVGSPAFESLARSDIDGLLLRAYDQIVKLSKDDDEFLEIAHTLREIRKQSNYLFKRVYGSPHLGRRNAYYLTKIDEVFGGLPELREQLVSVGWTKLGLIAPTVTNENIQARLAFAQERTAKEIQESLKGKAKPPKVRPIQLKFTPGQFEVFMQAIDELGVKYS